ncbi:MAG TPA: GGDEF domain-containing protein [Caulobacteraceae bacterium]|nr:GGDEF domain-containing protein [Caulobacteraceae bacterium]
MSVEVEAILRSPEAYGLASKALELMERHKVWPTALNYELWIHCVGDPDGQLAHEIHRLISTGEPITEAISEDLAASYLPKARINEQIRDAGDKLSRELDSVAKAIEAATKSSQTYGATLADASKELAADRGVEAVRALVAGLSEATRRVQRENSSLEKRLKDSTAEVGRLKEHLEQVRREATTDSLTNLANRKAFDEELERAREEAARTGEPLCLAVLDIDNFKRFNDTWGHQTGDQVIRYVASVMGRVAAPPRFAARYGGEEFGMLFPNESVRDVTRILEEIREEIASRLLRRRSTNEELGAITVSAGLAQLRGNESAVSLIDRADTALYASKRGGRNRVTCAETVKVGAAA